MNKKNGRLFHGVVEKLTQAMDQGVYPPGTRLPGERELAEEFGVSRVTIREAEVALQAMGRVTIKTGSGVYVAKELKVDEAAVPEVNAFELTEARVLFESEAAALAATLVTDEILAELETLCEALSCDATEPGHEAADREFHLTIARATRNRAIRHVIENLWRMRTDLGGVKRVHEDVCRREPGSRIDEHRQILEALKAHDPVAARAAMRAHFARLLASMVDASEARAIEQARKQAEESRKRYAVTTGLV